MEIERIERLVNEIIDNEFAILKIIERNPNDGSIIDVPDEKRKELKKMLEERLGIPVFVYKKTEKIYPALVIYAPDICVPLAVLEIDEKSGVVFTPKGRRLIARSYGLDKPINIEKYTGACTYWYDTLCCDPDDEMCYLYRLCMAGAAVGHTELLTAFSSGDGYG